MAILSVVADLGRPERLVSLIFNIKLASPLAWDFFFISIYFAFSLFYLFISMKKDIQHITEHFPGRAILYQTMNKIYNLITPKDDEKYENMLNLIALLILPFPVFGSGMVVAFIFSMLVARPIWNVPFFGPYFITAAVVSGISTVILIATVFRRIFNWEEIISSELILGLGNFLKIGIPFYLYFTFNEQFTIQYVRGHAELIVSDFLLFGQYAPIFWGMIIFGLLLPEIILVFPKTRNLTGVFIASILVTLALWVKRFIIVVPAMMFPNLPYDYGSYTITWVEWSIIAGIVAFGVIIYSVFIKLFPIIELE
jgi:molybdopterin-containing oxidoreductase family membrane subunit